MIKEKKDVLVSQQDQILQQLKQAAVPVAVYLLNGIKLQGKITQFDEHTLLLSGYGEQLVFKHAILSIVPQE